MTLTIHRGLPFRQTFQFFQDKEQASAVDVTGWSFALQFRKAPESPVLGTCTVTTSDAGEGLIQADMDAEDTLAMPAGRAVWDLIGEDAAGFSAVRQDGSAEIKNPISSLA